MTLNLTQSRGEEENGPVAVHPSGPGRKIKHNPCYTAAFPVENVDEGASLHPFVLPFTAFSRANHAMVKLNKTLQMS